MRRSLFLMGCALVASAATASPAVAEEAKPPISLAWQLIENQPDSHFTADLVLRNDGQVALQPGKWSLYFNSSRKLTAESVAKPFGLEQINGDSHRRRAETE